MAQVPLGSFSRTPAHEPWLARAQEVLGFRSGPGWPDDFGRKIAGWLEGKAHRPIRTLSLFSGGGGLDIGFHDCGFDVLEMVEIEKTYAATLSENASRGGLFEGANVKCMDIREYHPESSLNVDFIIGGPPCQTFSAAGRRAAGVLGTTDPRGVLFEEYVRLLKQLSPKGFLFENVYGIVGAQGGGPFEAIRAAFKDAGYDIHFRILDAADYGVPQHRERLFIVGLKTGSYRFPTPTHGPDSNPLTDYYSAGEAVRGVEEAKLSRPVRGRYGHLLEAIPPGLNYSFYTKELGHPQPVFAWRSKFSDFLYKADPASPARTLKAQGGQYTGPFHWENRPFTLDEFKRLQTFPDDYVIVGNRGRGVQQIGNSVPPQAARMLALSILNQVFNAPLPVSLEYLAPGRELGFRKRKRALTHHYAKVAREALQSVNRQKQEAPSVVEGREKFTRYLGPNFSWSEEPTGVPLTVRCEYSEAEWVIGVDSGAKRKAVWSLEIRQVPSKSWTIPTEVVRLQGGARDSTVFTAAWKAFEEQLSRHAKVADLVQLSGYYQYAPGINAALRLHVETEDDVWNVLQHITSGTCVAVDQPMAKFARAWAVSVSDIPQIMQALREFGFEVRNEFTNPQMSPGHYLVPYAFPTLAPQSVQLRKSLVTSSDAKS